MPLPEVACLTLGPAELSTLVEQMAALAERAVTHVALDFTPGGRAVLWPVADFLADLCRRAS